MSSTRHPEEIDISPEAIKSFLASHVTNILSYIQIRAKENGGLEKLFDDGERYQGGRFVLLEKPDDSEETKKLIQALTTMLDNEVMQLSIKEKIAKWQPVLTTEAINAINIDIQRRYFGPIIQSDEWRALIANSESTLSKSWIGQVQAAFCYWLSFRFLDSLGESTENVFLKKKAQLLVKVLNGMANFSEMMEEQRELLLNSLNGEFANIKTILGEGKHVKKELDNKLRDLLSANFEKILLNNWLPKEEKEIIALEAMDTFITNIKTDKKLEKHSLKICDELLTHFKSFIENAKKDTPRGLSPVLSREGLFLPVGRPRSGSLPLQIQNLPSLKGVLPNQSVMIGELKNRLKSKPQQ